MASLSSEKGFRLWLRRSGWLIAIWTISVLALGVAALLFRVLMSFAGLTA
jgi:hypothetical protein